MSPEPSESRGAGVEHEHTRRASWHERLGDGNWLPSTWFRALAALRLYRRLILLERPLDEPIGDVSSIRVGDGAALTRDDVDAYRALRPDQDRDQVLERLTAGHGCFVTWQDGRIISASWLARDSYWIDFLERGLTLAPDEACVYDLFTAPDHRRRGATGARAMALMDHARRAGYRRLLAAVLPENRAAFHGPIRFGYRPIGVIGFVGLGPWRRHFCRLRPGHRGPGAPPAAEAGSGEVSC